MQILEKTDSRLKQQFLTLMTQYEIEEVINRRVYSGKVLYLVKWRGYGEATWQSVKVLKNAKHLIAAYNSLNKNQENKQDIGINTPKVKRGRPKKDKKTIVTKRENIQIHSSELFFDSDENRSDTEEKVHQRKPVCVDQARTQTTEIEIVDRQSFASTAKLLNEVETPDGNQQEHDVKKEENEGMTIMAGVSESKEATNNFMRIYLVEQDKEQVRYFVEYPGKHVCKYTSEELLEKHPRELIKFLEASLLKKLQAK